MADNKEFFSRIVHKHDTEANWNNTTNFIPLQGEIIIYDIDANHDYNRVKIGDGTTNVINLPFIVDIPNIVANGLPYCVCDTSGLTAAKEATVISGNFNLFTGATVIVKFTNANAASSPTLNVNGTGAKPIYLYGTTAAGTTYVTNGWYANSVQIFTYDGTGWIRNYWSNSTYSNASLGQGYGTCTTAAATTAKTASLSSYTLTTGGIVSIKFAYDVPANATLNINSKGAKSIYYMGAAIAAGVIKADDIATFIYNGSQYHLISIDRWHNDIVNIQKDLNNKFRRLGDNPITAANATLPEGSVYADLPVTWREIGTGQGFIGDADRVLMENYPNQYNAHIFNFVTTTNLVENSTVHQILFTTNGEVYHRYAYQGDLWSSDWIKMHDDTNAVSIINATGSSNDMNTIFKSGAQVKFYRTNGETLNTPYKAGLTGTLVGAYILTLTGSTTYGKQIAYINGGGTFERRMSNGTIEGWQRVINNDNDLTALNNAINEIRQSFQDGCDTIVDGCTTYGSTPSTNSPADIVTAIGNISTNRYNAGVSATKVGTAVASNVLTGKTFTNSSGVGISGTMQNNGAVSQTLAVNGTYTIPAGYHNGSGKVTQSLTTKAATTYRAKTSDQTIAAGQYLNGAQTIKKVEHSGLTAANIVKGKTITISSNGSNLWSVTGTASNAEFNFNIVNGTSQPSSPTTNTIWINTSTAIGEWMIAKTAPSARRDGSALQTGDIWFVLDDFSRSVSLHLLKSNRTYVNIHTAHQWNGSSWVTKEASIYQSSKWVSIPRIYRVFPSDYACTWGNWTISTNKGTWAYSSNSMYFYGHSSCLFLYIQ